MPVLPFTRIILSGALLVPSLAVAQEVAPTPLPSPTPVVAPTPAAPIYASPKEVIDKIKDEGLNRSQIMGKIGTLTDVIGARLTGSPALKRANQWTRDEMTKDGLQNAHLEKWGPFGRGWTVQKFFAQITKPAIVPLIAYPRAWSPGTDGAVTGEVIYFNAKTDEEYARYKGLLKGKIVLISEPRELKAVFDPLATRRTDEALTKLAQAPDPATVTPAAPADPKIAYDRLVATAKRMNFLKQEGVAVVVDNSTGGSGGTVFVLGATVPQDIPANVADASKRNKFQPFDKNSQPRMVPQITMATEQYNRLFRMVQAGEKPRVTVKIGVKYYDKDPMAYNTIAEIPGTNLKDEVVMIGGHLDSWHSGTGATDNAAGVAVAMEAARIIKATGLQPRRTIRVALWTGEEHGLLGSSAYVKAHLGELKPAEGDKKGELIKKADYEKLAAYYNLDGGTGKIRGMFSQGNLAAAPIFAEWLKPFAEMGAGTMTLSNTGGTDHLSFDKIGLPGFQFIQDPVEYGSRTHHSNQDVYDRIQPDDVKQSAVIMAAFAYQTAMMDEKMPRKPLVIK